MHAMEDIVVIPSRGQTNHTNQSYGQRTGPLSKKWLNVYPR